MTNNIPLLAVIIIAHNSTCVLRGTRDAAYDAALCWSLNSYTIELLLVQKLQKWHLQIHSNMFRCIFGASLSETTVSITQHKEYCMYMIIVLADHMY